MGCIAAIQLTQHLSHLQLHQLSIQKVEAISGCSSPSQLSHVNWLACATCNLASTSLISSICKKLKHTSVFISYWSFQLSNYNKNICFIFYESLQLSNSNIYIYHFLNSINLSNCQFPAHTCISNCQTHTLAFILLTAAEVVI